MLLLEVKLCIILKFTSKLMSLSAKAGSLLRRPSPTITCEISVHVFQQVVCCLSDKAHTLFQYVSPLSTVAVDQSHDHEAHPGLIYDEAILCCVILIISSHLFVVL